MYYGNFCWLESGCIAYHLGALGLWNSSQADTGQEPDSYSLGDI